MLIFLFVLLLLLFIVILCSPDLALPIYILLFVSTAVHSRTHAKPTPSPFPDKCKSCFINDLKVFSFKLQFKYYYVKTNQTKNNPIEGGMMIKFIKII